MHAPSQLKAFRLRAGGAYLSSKGFKQVHSDACVPSSPSPPPLQVLTTRAGSLTHIVACMYICVLADRDVPNAWRPVHHLGTGGKCMPAA